MIDDNETARACRRRDAGIASSTTHAESASPGWSADAFNCLTHYADTTPGEWTAEQMRQWAHAQGLEEPPDLRSWGGVVARAIHRNVIQRVGAAPTNSSNRSLHPTYIGTVWR